MDNVIRGRTVKLGDNINTDLIAPVRWMRQSLDELRLHTMEAIRPDFYKEVTPGTILVAGRNFGCGSHREQATEIMLFMGVSVIVAESVARLYFRNAIAFGLPLFVVPGISEVAKNDDKLEISIDKCSVRITNLSTGLELTAPPIPAILTEILEAGGIYKLLKQRLFFSI